MITATINRIKQDIESPQQNSSTNYGTVVMAALATMHRIMNSIDNELAFKAASAILEIEKARLRHKMPIAVMEPTPTGIGVTESSEELTASKDMNAKQFESAVDEIVVTLNKIQTEKGEPEFPRELLREQYKQKLDDIGFDEFLNWHNLMMGNNDRSKTLQRKERHRHKERMLLVQAPNAVPTGVLRE